MDTPVRQSPPGWRIFLCPGLALAGLLLALPAAGASLGELEFEPCVLTAAGLPRPVEARCATLEVPENPAEHGGRRIELALAWVPAEGQAEPDPVFFIAGGPGQSARESFPMVAPAFADILRHRHVLLLDQRGTGGSNLLQCPEEDGASWVSRLTPDSPGQLREFAARCRDALEPLADLRFYTTTDAVHDLERVRQAIGARQLNLVGVSYGTRVAQQYAKAHPERVRTLVLDSVVAPEPPLGAEMLENFESALEAQLARCAATPACSEAFGPVGDALGELLGLLHIGSFMPTQFRDATSGEWREATLRTDHLLGVLRMYAYMPLTATLLPLLIAQSTSGDFSTVLALAGMLERDLGNMIAQGMYYSVICSEDADALVPRDPEQASLFDDPVVAIQAQCEAWPRGALPADFRAPLTGEIPALLISGEYDPVTPPRYGDQVAAELRHARHVVLRGQAHSLLSTGCMPKLVARFIESADALALDAACLERIAPLPPVSGMHGWEP